MLFVVWFIATTGRSPQRSKLLKALTLICLGQLSKRPGLLPLRQKLPSHRKSSKKKRTRVANTAVPSLVTSPIGEHISRPSRFP